MPNIPIQTLQEIQKSLKQPLKILPPHRVVSVPAEILDIADIREDSVGMSRIVAGLYKARVLAFALAHSEVNSVRPLRYFVMNPYVEGWSGPLLIINPEFVGISAPKVVKESCLSSPEQPPIQVRRYYKIQAKFYDEHWRKHQEVFRGVQAQIFQHEIDHMDGKSIYNAVLNSGIILPT